MIFITSISFNILADRLRAAMAIKEAMQPFINIDLGGPAQPLLKVNNLLKHFPAGGGKARAKWCRRWTTSVFSDQRRETLGGWGVGLAVNPPPRGC